MLSAVLVLLACTVGIALALGWRAMGQKPSGARQARIEKSPQWKDGHFENPQPMKNRMGMALLEYFHRSPDTTPKAPLPVVTVEPGRFATPPTSGVRATWLGHSTFFLELDGGNILVDPLWSMRPSPLSFIGPRRWYAPLIALSDLPVPDAVVISHDHYDHLDYPTISAMKDWKTTFVVPLGIGSHLEYWGVSPDRIVELDWWDKATVGALDIVATPARHASGRTFGVGDGSTLWCGFAFHGNQHRIYYSGDTGLFPGITEIGTRLGPFDLTIIDAGQYGKYWPDWHLGPEQTVRAHQAVQGKVLLPAHWALLTLAYHAWTEPIERVLAAAKIAHVTVALPRPGESIDPLALPEQKPWWPTVPGQTGEEAPIVSSACESLGSVRP